MPSLQYCPMHSGIKTTTWYSADTGTLKHGSNLTSKTESSPLPLTGSPKTCQRFYRFHSLFLILISSQSKTGPENGKNAAPTQTEAAIVVYTLLMPGCYRTWVMRVQRIPQTAGLSVGFGSSDLTACWHHLPLPFTTRKFQIGMASFLASTCSFLAACEPATPSGRIMGYILYNQ